MTADVLVTGASRGIGLALTREYLARGARVFAGVRDPDRAVALRELAGDRLVVLRFDVTSTVDIEAAAEVIAAGSGGLDVLVNNAGTGSTADGLSGVDGDRMRAVLELNTVAPVLVIQRFVPLLRPGARLVNLTMPSRPIGAVTRTADLAFVGSRYALNAMTRMIALELAGTGPVVVALWPGYLRTDLNNHDEAATPPEEAIPGVVDLIERLGPDDNGTCLLPDGTRFEW